MKKIRLRWLAVLLAGVWLLGGCNKASVPEAKMYSGATKDEMAEMDTAAGAMESPEMAADDSGGAVNTEAGAGGMERAADPNRKLVKRQSLTLETKEFDKLTEFVQEQVKKSGGYIENSSVSGTSIDRAGNRYANYIIRIPVTGLDDFVSVLKENGNATFHSEYVEDVTLSYVDTESRIAALKTEQETLMNMLAQSGDLESLLAIQSRLTEVRYQLESHESQLRLYDNEIEYSTVTLDVQEVERETAVDDGTFGSRLKEQFSDNLYSIGNGLKNFAIWFLGALPYWIILAVVAVVALVIVKSIRRKIRKRKEECEAKPDEKEEETK